VRKVDGWFFCCRKSRYRPQKLTKLNRALGEPEMTSVGSLRTLLPEVVRKENVLIVLVCGASTLTVWDSLQRDLVKDGWRTAAVQLPGWGDGKVALEDVTFAGSVDYLVEAVSKFGETLQLGPNARIHIIAHSFGADVVIAANERCNFSGMHLVAPAFDLWSIRFQLLSLFFRLAPKLARYFSRLPYRPTTESLWKPLIG
jgi:alpha-beta hydrolase superfamily lysophospholipase